MRALRRVKSIRLPGRKLWWIIGAIVLLCVLIGSIAYVGSVRYWDAYQKNSTAAFEVYRSQFDAALKADQSERLVKLEAVHDTIPSDDLCTQPVAVRWQKSVINALREYDVRCHDQLSELRKIDAELGATIQYFSANRQLAKLLKETSGSTELDESKLEETAKAWQKLAGEIEKVSSTQLEQDMRSELAKRAAAVSVAWGELQEANSAKDRAKYEASAAKVATTYDELGTLVTSSEKLTSDQISKLEKLYAEVFF